MYEAFPASAAFRAKDGCTVFAQPEMQQTVNNPFIQFQHLYDSCVLPSSLNVVYPWESVFEIQFVNAQARLIKNHCGLERSLSSSPRLLQSSSSFSDDTPTCAMTFRTLFVAAHIGAQHVGRFVELSCPVQGTPLPFRSN